LQPAGDTVDAAGDFGMVAPALTADDAEEAWGLIVHFLFLVVAGCCRHHRAFSRP
jgi:hypothetical protein